MEQPVLAVQTPDLAPALGQIFVWFAKTWPFLLLIIKWIFSFILTISFPLSLFFLIWLVYTVEQLKKVRKEEEKKYDLPVVQAYEKTDTAKDQALAKRWQSASKHMESANENDWRQAIIDADIILDDLLNKMGYRGETVGEKLKRVAVGDFATLNDAWEGHKVRNRIAHEGVNFHLSHHEAIQAFNYYKRVFEEFYYIPR